MATAIGATATGATAIGATATGATATGAAPPRIGRWVFPVGGIVTGGRERIGDVPGQKSVGAPPSRLRRSTNASSPSRTDPSIGDASNSARIFFHRAAAHRRVSPAQQGFIDVIIT